MLNTITADQHEGLSEDFKKEYTKNDDGSFNLNIEGGADVGALKRAKDHEKTARKQAEDNLKEANGKLSDLETKMTEMLKGAVPKNDVDALEKQYQTKNSELEATYKSEIENLSGSLKTILVDNKALAIASDISTSPDLILPHITKRLTTDVVDGETVTRVLGKDGKISADTIDDLKKEFISNDNFAKIIKASDGSGSGADGQNASGASGKANVKKLDFATASVKDKVAHIKAQRKASGMVD